VPAAASRNHPFNGLTHGSQLAPYLPGQPRRTDLHGAAGRLCLSPVSLRRLGGVAESPEELVAARRGGHPASPVREMLNLPYLIAGVIRLNGLEKAANWF
jgi:hypothetical protein